MAMMMPAIAPPFNALDFAASYVVLLIDGNAVEGTLVGNSDAIGRDGLAVGCSDGMNVTACGCELRNQDARCEVQL